MKFPFFLVVKGTTLEAVSRKREMPVAIKSLADVPICNEKEVKISREILELSPCFFFCPSRNNLATIHCVLFLGHRKIRIDPVRQGKKPKEDETASTVNLDCQEWDWVFTVLQWL